MILRRVSPLYRFLFLLVFSAALMIVDHRSSLLTPVRTVGALMVLPFQMLLGMPAAVGRSVASYYPDKTLSLQYAALEKKQRMLEARLQRYDALQAENQRLSGLLSIPRNADGHMLLAEIVDAGLDKYTHRIAINRGSEAGIYIGQPAITPDGVLGQISYVGLKRSVVTLITDPSHTIPVQIQRNGLRTIVRGLGGTGRVSVPFLSGQADIRKDDILVTSGLGGGFPLGYKVGQVRKVVPDANEPFLRVTADIYANIESATETLLLWHRKPRPGTAADSADSVTASANGEADGG